MSTSLVAVFIPILMMGGIVGRVFREFAVTLSIAIGVSLLVSLTVTPMMCARFLKPITKEGHNWLYRMNERSFNALLAAYERGVRWVLKHQPLTLADHHRHGLPQRRALLLHSQGIFPAAGRRRDGRVDPGRARHVIRFDEQEGIAVQRTSSWPIRRWRSHRLCGRRRHE